MTVFCAQVSLASPFACVNCGRPVVRNNAGLSVHWLGPDAAVFPSADVPSWRECDVVDVQAYHLAQMSPIRRLLFRLQRSVSS